MTRKIRRFKGKLAEVNRKQRKECFIKAKNRLRSHPDTDYGDFFCDHILDDPNYPCQWVDFIFYHSKIRRYFAVALQTVAHAAFNIAENKAIDDSILATPESLGPKFEVTKKFSRLVFSEEDLRRVELCEQLTFEYAELPYEITPGIKIADYGLVAVGVHAIVNRNSIDERVIREFIADFRVHGEPTKAGWTWENEKVTVVPGRANRIEATE